MQINSKSKNCFAIEFNQQMSAAITIPADDRLGDDDGGFLIVESTTLVQESDGSEVR